MSWYRKAQFDGEDRVLRDLNKADQILKTLRQNPSPERVQEAYRLLITNDPSMARWEGITRQEVDNMKRERSQKLQEFNASRGEDSQAYEDAMRLNEDWVDAIISFNLQRNLNSLLARFQQVA
jgi:hypothetical protein